MFFGADFDRRILFRENRIRTTWCDQTNPGTILQMWRFPEFAEPYDIIIEDALHTFEANVCFLEHSLERTRKFFIIEDVSRADLAKFSQKIMDWYYEGRFRNFSFSFYESAHKLIDDDNMIIVRRINDFKESPMYPCVVENWEHITALANIMETTIADWKGCGSYMCNGNDTDYAWAFFYKQELLWKTIRELTDCKLLEIGVHGAQSLLLILMASPELEIVAIDPCFWKHTAACV